jgi:arylsulfatase A-like enzyme
MKALMVMFDSLNRHFLPPYGCDWTHAPNFARLAQRCVTFDKSYVCSMPCMPARRDLHTARPRFLHRDWGPLEPFDDSVPQMLKENGIYTHLATDHFHYFSDGGANYHTRYNSWEYFRGQAGDPWIGQVERPSLEAHLCGPRDRKLMVQDLVNRPHLCREELQPQTRTFTAGLNFLDCNYREDNWFLQIETFDPHEPFFAPQSYHELYPHEYSGSLFDWPAYGPVTETPEQVEHARLGYAALLSMCDAHLGKVLDAMDEYALWDDTLLMVWTDHGFLLGEHESWAKVWCPWWEELSHTPFFMHDPRSPHPGERRNALVQPALDLGPTLLEYFGLEPTSDMIGKSLRPVVENDAPIRDAAIFGHFGGHVNVTDGRHVLMRGGDAATIYHHTLMPQHRSARFEPALLENAELAPPFRFTKNCPTFKIPRQTAARESLLFDLQTDPRQQTPLHDHEIATAMNAHLRHLLGECDAPCEQWQRLGLEPN